MSRLRVLVLVLLLFASLARFQPVVAQVATPQRPNVAAACERAVVLDRSKAHVALRRATDSGWETLHTATDVDATSAVVAKGGIAHVAVTRHDQSPVTDLWSAGCTAEGGAVSVHALPHVLMLPEVFATAEAIYLFDRMPWGEERMRVPVRQVSGTGEEGLKTYFPCRNGYRPVELSVAADGKSVRASCFSGGNQPDSSYEVDM